ncbi:MAG: ABC transporter ATP-binding protein [Firmicutes bacterium]|nr:ABC transporter ATP-binding protein [Bacillota bacterium]
MSNRRDAYISMDKLAVGYNGKAIIKDICIDIGKGEIVTLIGPNGAGKSTILKSITRQLSLISGKVWYGEKNLHKMTAKEVSTKMAVVLTERLKAELMTCYDIVASGRYPYTGKLGLLTEEDERMVDEAMAAVNATEFGPKDFNAISDGQKQRVLLARAICQDPEIIILDEPTSFLDVRYKLELLSILRNMAKKKGITVIMSLHEIDLAEKISDKIICVKGDHIYRYGTPEEVFEEEMIRDLYSIDNGFFDPLLGSIELPAPTGDTDGEANAAEPKVLVISAGGSGIPVYRRLQKQNIPFIAGILSENDIDYQLARLLAAEVITTPAFEPISEEAFAKAMDAVARCDRVIDTDFPIGSANKRIEFLLQAADDAGKLERV